MTEQRERLISEDRYDRRKVLYHPRALADLLEAGDTWPVTVNTGFTTYCNHSCVWCSSAYTTRIEPSLKTRNELIIQPDVWINTIRRLAKGGTKGLIIAGQGEPLLHPEGASMLDAVADTGMHFMLFTNGQRMHERYHDSFFKSAAAIRFSVDAATESLHAQWHAAENAQGRGRSNFGQVVENIGKLVLEKRRRGTDLPHLGCQMICSSLTRSDFEEFARFFRDLGVDYVVYKPLQSNTATRSLVVSALDLHGSQEERATYAKEMIAELLDIKARYQRPGFEVHVKMDQIAQAYVKKFNGAERYKKCRAHPLTPMIEPNGDVYVCIDHGGSSDMVIGNIYDDDFDRIWRSEQRQKVIDSIDLVNRCPAGCFLDQANVILDELDRPDPSLHTMLI